MADLTNIAISSVASSAADRLMETNLFKQKSDLLMFAAGYMIKHHLTDFLPETYVLSDSDGSNYAFSTFDGEGKWAALIRALYPDCTTPYLYLRALMDKGVLLIAQQILDDASYSLVNELII